MIRIIHAADFHLDSPFESLSPDRAAQRRREQREGLLRLRDLAADTGAQVILLAGDLLDSDNAFHETTEMLRQVFAQMDAHIFIAPGNHDYYSPRSPWRSERWPENVHIFRGTRPECVELPELNCRVYGAGFLSASCPDPILRGFSAPRDGRVNLMVLHGDTAAVTAQYNPISQEDIAASGLDYLALGHTHAFSGILRAGDTDYAYCGCMEGRGFDETGDKGVIAGSVAPGRTELEFVPLCRRRYHILTVDYETLLRGEAELPENREDICRIVLTGPSDGPLDTEGLAAALSGRFWHYTLRDRTVPRRDLWSLAREDSLKGTFVRQLRSSYDRADEQQQALIRLALDFGVAAMENGEVSL